MKPLKPKAHNLKPIARAVKVSLLGLGLAHASAMAATIEVTSNADDDAGALCTLREAISSMNTAILSGDCEYYNGMGTFGLNNRILFNSGLAGQTIELAGSELVLGFRGQIDGSTASGITIDANQLDHVFTVNTDVSMNDLTLTGAAGDFGGAIAVFDSQLHLENMTITGNSASRGAGIYLAAESSLTLANSTVHGNSSNRFGGGILADYASVEISNSTISGNTSSREGGGLHLRNGSTAEINNSTFSENFGSTGGAIFLSNSSASIKNTVLANSTGGGDCSPTLTSDTASIIEDGTCANLARSIDPRLGPLADNGGPTLTHALRPTSPARDSGILADCETFDQRQQLRDDGDGNCDVGAIEFNEEDEFGDDGNLFVIPLGDNKAVVIPN